MSLAQVQTESFEPSPNALPIIAELARDVASHPIAERLDGWLPAWSEGSGALAEFINPDNGEHSGLSTRDLGDITPYLWLLRGPLAVETLHAAAEETDDGLLETAGRMRAFDNHDYVLSFYLLYRISGAESWRQEFLRRCRALAGHFFNGQMPPTWIAANGTRSVKRSAFGYGLLELFVLAQSCDADGLWLETVAEEIPAIRRILDRQQVHIMPRAALQFYGITLFDPRPGRLHARLFKDNTNLVHALDGYYKATGDQDALDILQDLIRSVSTTLMAAGDGWVRTELNKAFGTARSMTPSLIGNTAALNLFTTCVTVPVLSPLISLQKALSVIEVPYSLARARGLFPVSPADDRQHLDITVDFVVSAAMVLHAICDEEAAMTLLNTAISAVDRHVTDHGFATFADEVGPRGKVCVKYNFLILKLLVCRFLLTRHGRLTATERQFIADVFLIDR